MLLVRSFNSCLKNFKKFLKDPGLLNEDWTCEDNPNKRYNKCSAKEENYSKTPVSLRVDEFFE